LYSPGIPSRSQSLSFNLAALPTEPFSAVAKLVPPLGGVDITPVWVGIFSLLELLLGQQGLLTMILT